jgi:hypothetical protein
MHADRLNMRFSLDFLAARAPDTLCDSGDNRMQEMIETRFDRLP